MVLQFSSVSMKCDTIGLLIPATQFMVHQRGLNSIQAFTEKLQRSEKALYNEATELLHLQERSVQNTEFFRNTTVTWGQANICHTFFYRTFQASGPRVDPF